MQRHAIGGDLGLTAAQRAILTPPTARFGQLYNRTGGVFIESAKGSSATRVASIGSLFVAGDLVRGGINRTALIDFAEQSGLSEGELYMARRGSLFVNHFKKQC